jgi:hypothetical protein
LFPTVPNQIESPQFFFAFHAKIGICSEKERRKDEKSKEKQDGYLDVSPDIFFLQTAREFFRHEDPHSRPRRRNVRENINKHFRLNLRGGTENIAVSTTTRRNPPQPNEHANIAKAKQGQISKVERKTGSTKIIRTTTPLNSTHSIPIQKPAAALTSIATQQEEYMRNGPRHHLLSVDQDIHMLSIDRDTTGSTRKRYRRAAGQIDRKTKKNDNPDQASLLLADREIADRADLV